MHAERNPPSLFGKDFGALSSQEELAGKKVFLNSLANALQVRWKDNCRLRQGGARLPVRMFAGVCGLRSRFVACDTRGIR